ncbi:MAG: VWA domain-containing protein [Bacteroidales bacterium]|nr:VWA domain-containing protein [Bacteroidales bacterium]MDZ4203689.1 VWA domain-containing protein [Bacteroidales bacterium]
MLLLIFGIAALIIGLANPQIGSTLEKRERKGVDIIIALDVSNSMLSQDIKPNRLEKARQSIGRIIDQLDNDRLGIIVFAGKAYPMLPITHDHVAAKMFLSNINTDIVPTQGTSIADAIDLAIRSFPEGEHGKALVLITDGEDHQGDVLEKVKEAETKGIVIHTIGMGSQQGAPIPLYSGANQVGFRKTRDGQTIITRINEPMLQQIATAGRGIYVRASNSQAGLQRIHDEIYKMQKTEFDSQVFSDYDSRYYYFLMLAFIFLLIELFVFERSRRWSRNLKYFLPFLVLALTQPAYSQSEPALVRRGNKQYDKGNFKDSEVNYRKALEKDPRSFRGTYNLGNSTYRQENYEEALNTYQQSSLYKADDMQLAKAYHNLGNTMLKAKKLPEGIEAYKQSLRLNPMDDDTRYNLAYAMKLLDQQQQQSGDDKNDKTEKKDDQKDDKKNQDQKDQEQNPTEQQQSEARQPRQISKQEAERMLQAMKEEEQKTLDKVKQQRLKGQRVTIEKDW